MIGLRPRTVSSHPPGRRCERCGARASSRSCRCGGRMVARCLQCPGPMLECPTATGRLAAYDGLAAADLEVVSHALQRAAPEHLATLAALLVDRDAPPLDGEGLD